MELGASSGSKTAIINGVKPGTRVFIDLPPWAKTRLSHGHSDSGGCPPKSHHSAPMPRSPRRNPCCCWWTATPWPSAAFPYAFSKGGDGGLATKDGVPTSVTYGFLKALLDNCKSLTPQGVAIAFDTAEPTFRHEADPNYKAHRDVAPEVFFQDLDQLQGILRQPATAALHGSRL